MPISNGSLFISIKPIARSHTAAILFYIKKITTRSAYFLKIHYRTRFVDPTLSQPFVILQYTMQLS